MRRIFNVPYVPSTVPPCTTCHLHKQGDRECGGDEGEDGRKTVGRGAPAGDHLPQQEPTEAANQGHGRSSPVVAEVLSSNHITGHTLKRWRYYFFLS